MPSFFLPTTVSDMKTPESTFSDLQANQRGNRVNFFKEGNSGIGDNNFISNRCFKDQIAYKNSLTDAINSSLVANVGLDQYKLQLYNYALSFERFRYPPYLNQTRNSLPTPIELNDGNNERSFSPIVASQARRLAFSMSVFPNKIFTNDEPKPQHSYIGLIAMAILSSADSKLVLSDIYQYILDNYPYFRTRGPGWRNSIRHNLSLNDCFVKAGRSANGKGHYWAIHPANLEDFRKGDFRRRKAQRKVRKHMGLSVDDNGTDSPSPPPLDLTNNSYGFPFPPTTTFEHKQCFNFNCLQRLPKILNNSPEICDGIPSALIANRNYAHQHRIEYHKSNYQTIFEDNSCTAQQHQLESNDQNPKTFAFLNRTTTTKSSMLGNICDSGRKRQFDVASLLAPETKETPLPLHSLDDDEINTFGKNLTASRRTHHHHTLITKVSVQQQHHIISPLDSEDPQMGIEFETIEDQEHIDVEASDADEEDNLLEQAAKTEDKNILNDSNIKPLYNFSSN